MSTEKLEIAAAVVAMVGFVVCLVAIRGLIRERDEWRGCAGSLARCVRGLDPLPLVEEHNPAFEWLEAAGLPIVADDRVPEGQPALRPVEMLTPDAAPLRLVRYARLPIPPAVAVVGRSAQLDRWSIGAAHALRQYDLLLEPEGGR